MFSRLNTSRTGNSAQRQNTIHIPHQAVQNLNPQPTPAPLPVQVPLQQMQRRFEFGQVFDFRENNEGGIQRNEESHTFWEDAFNYMIGTESGKVLMSALGKRISIEVGSNINGYDTRDKVLFLRFSDDMISYMKIKRSRNVAYKQINIVQYAAINLFHELVHAWHDTYSLTPNVTLAFFCNLMTYPEIFLNVLEAYNGVILPDKVHTFYRILINTGIYEKTQDDFGMLKKIPEDDYDRWSAGVTNQLTLAFGSNFLPLGLALTSDMVDDVLTVKPVQLTDRTLAFLASQLNIPIELALILNENNFRNEINVPLRRSYTD